MDKLGKLDLGGIVSLGVVAAALLAGWIATSAQIAASHEQRIAKEAVSLTADGRMKVTVTATAANPEVSRQVNVATTLPTSSRKVSTLAPVAPRS
jgi:hypothetical protein